MKERTGTGFKRAAAISLAIITCFSYPALPELQAEELLSAEESSSGIPPETSDSVETAAGTEETKEEESGETSADSVGTEREESGGERPQATTEDAVEEGSLISERETTEENESLQAETSEESSQSGPEASPEDNSSSEPEDSSQSETTEPSEEILQATAEETSQTVMETSFSENSQSEAEEPSQTSAEESSEQNSQPVMETSPAPEETTEEETTQTEEGDPEELELTDSITELFRYASGLDIQFTPLEEDYSAQSYVGQGLFYDDEMTEQEFSEYGEILREYLYEEIEMESMISLDEDGNEMSYSGMGAALSHGPSISYAYWSTNKFYINSDTGVTHTGFCANASKGTPASGRYIISELTGETADWLKAVMIIGSGGDLSAKYESVIFGSSIGDEAMQFCYTHGVISYIYSGDLAGLSTETRQGCINIANFAYLVAGLGGHTDTADPELTEILSRTHLFVLQTGNAYQDIVWIEEEAVSRTGQLSLTKTGTWTGSDAVTAGAVYGIYSDADCLSLVSLMTTDDSGYAVSEKLPVGTYYVKEVSAQDGVNLTNSHYSSSEVPVYTVNVTADTVQPVNNDYVVSDDEWYTEVTLTKKDAENGTLLVGAVFGLYEYQASSGSYVFLRNLADNGNGTYSSGTIYYTKNNQGKYKVTEITPPIGYQSTGWEQEFTLSSVSSGLAYTVTNPRVRGSISIRKQNADGDPLSGVTFALYSTEAKNGAEVTSYQGKNFFLVGEKTTGAEGVITFSDLTANGSCEYILIEKETADGYSLLKDPVYVGTLPKENSASGEEYDADLEYTVLDGTTFRVPLTGGSGHVPYMIAVAFAGSSALILLIRRKKHDKKEENISGEQASI